MKERIQILPNHVACQIAAGEVVERPASVVKELLENSLDANAFAIDIEIKNGGMKLIRINDDGKGIHKDDLLLAIAQHGTSKIRELSELTHIVSLGFRGEALASITSIADFCLTSKQDNADCAWTIDNEKLPQPAAQAKGTSIEVRNIFHNIPVRRKFLKSERTEFQYIEDVVKRVALCAFSVAFVLRHNDRQVLNVKPAHVEIDYLSRIGKIVGKNFSEHAVSIDVERSSIRLWGWVLPPELSRAHADIQYFFVNGRIVKDKIINHAIRSAFKDIYEQGRYPAYILYLECEPAFVDVNVHPTKHEVRFQEQRLVHDFVQYSLQKLFAADELSIERDESLFYQQAKVAPAHYISEPQGSYRAAAVENVFAKAVAFVAEKFIIAYTDETLFIIDYAKAQRYLNQDLITREIVRAQPLLIPETVSCNEQLATDLFDREEKWQQFGISLRQASPKTIMVQALPNFLHGALLDELLSELSQLDSPNEMIQCLIRHSFIAKQLSLQEMNQLLQRLSTYSLPQLKQEKIVQQFSSAELQALMS